MIRTLTLIHLSFVLVAATVVGCHHLDDGYHSWDGVVEPAEVFGNKKVVALASAAQRGDIEAIDNLVASGAAINAEGRGKITPLMCAVAAKNKVGFRRLLELGANPNVEMANGLGVMYFCADSSDDSEWLELALRHGGNPNLVCARNRFCPQRTPIFDAIEAHNVVGVGMLIEAGADLSHRNKEGETPLGFAMARRHFDIVYLLLQAGADHREGLIPGDDVLAMTRRYLGGSKLARAEQISWARKCLDILEERETQATGVAPKDDPE